MTIKETPLFLLGRLECISGKVKTVIPLSFIYQGDGEEDYEQAWITFSKSFFESSDNVERVKFIGTHVFTSDGIVDLGFELLFSEISLVKDGEEDVQNDVQ